MALDPSKIGKPISLISIHSNVRYRGILAGIDLATSTIQLSNVYAMGTESRQPTTAGFIPPLQESYQYIIFRASDIRDLVLDEDTLTWSVLDDAAVLRAAAATSPNTNSIQTGASSIESVEHALADLQLSTSDANAANSTSHTFTNNLHPENDQHNGQPLAGNIFSPDFIEAVAQTLDAFDPAIFNPNRDANFERDFGQWFNRDVVWRGDFAGNDKKSDDDKGNKQGNEERDGFLPNPTPPDLLMSDGVDVNFERDFGQWFHQDLSGKPGHGDGR